MDSIDKVINTRLNAVEETMKQAMELIIDAHSQCSMISYLMVAKKSSLTNVSKIKE